MGVCQIALNVLLSIFLKSFLLFTLEIKAIAGVKQVEGLDFDWTTQNLYWVDSAKKVIEVCRKDGLYRKTVHIDKLDKPRALALDPPMGWVKKIKSDNMREFLRIFYQFCKRVCIYVLALLLSPVEKNSSILQSSAEISTCVSFTFQKALYLERRNLKSYWFITLDPRWPLTIFCTFREMFWTDWGQKPKIEMSDMDGKNRVILVDSDIVWPNGLAIDIYNRKSSRILYYTDAKLDKIGSYNMHTKKKKVKKHTTVYRYWPLPGRGNESPPSSMKDWGTADGNSKMSHTCLAGPRQQVGSQRSMG